MRTGVVVVFLGLFLAVSSCKAQEPQAPAQAQAQPAQPNYQITGTVKDIMDAFVDPGSDVLWDAVETTVSAKGIEEKAPHTDEEWKNVRNHALMLLEATNLLQMPGRHVAKAGEKAEDPKVELAPEQIEDLINKDRTSWIGHATKLHEATLAAFKAIEAKDAMGLLDAGNGIDNACENCHLQYWYPNEKKPESLPSQKKSTE